MNKRGTTIENFYAPVKFLILTIFFLVLLIFWGVASNISNFWDASSIGTTIKTNAQKGFDTFDFMLLCFYFAIHISILLMAYFSRSHPILLVVSFILMLLLPLISAPIANVYDDVVINGSAFSSVTSDIPITNLIMSRLPFFEILWSALTLVVMYSGVRGGMY